MILLTGATGHLGQQLLFELLAARQPVAVLVRGSHRATPRERIEELVASFERQNGRLLSRPVVIPGNLQHADLGITADWREWIGQHCDAVLHSAACVVFDRHTQPNRDVFLNNVEGTRRLLDLCREARIRQFHYVSSAYSCGVRDEAVPEERHPEGLTFRNDYEESKHAAERLVRDCAWIDPPTIYRPSIIVGDLQTGRVQGEPTVYGALYVMSILPREVWETRSFCGTVGLTGRETKNLVPVDWVARVMVRILGQPALHGQTYHLTNPQPATVLEIEQGFLQAIRARADAPAVADDLVPSPDAPEMGERFATVYQPYFVQDPTFRTDRVQQAAPDLQCPRIGVAELAFLGQVYLSSAADKGSTLAETPAVCRQMHELADADPVYAEIAHEATTVGLWLVGPGGGTWRLCGTEDEPWLVPGDAAPPLDNGGNLLTIFAQATTFAELVAGQLDVVQAARQGRLAAWVGSGASGHGSAAACSLDEVAAVVRTVQTILKPTVSGRDGRAVLAGANL